MADNTPQGKISGIKQAWRNPKAKKGLILGFGLISIILLISFMTMNRQNSKPVGPVASAKVVAPPTGLDDVTGKTQENYKELVRSADQERSERLKTNSTAMVLPRVTGMSDPEQVRKEEEQRLAVERGKARAQEQAAAAAPVRTSGQVAGGPQQQTIDPNTMVRQSDSYRVSLALLKRVADQGMAAQGSFTPLLTPAVLTDKQSGNAAQNVGASPGQALTSAAGSSTLTSAQLNPPKPLLRAGEVTFANTDIALNSDYSGPITATIREGKFSGARLMGQKSLERDAVVIRFNTLSPADGTASFPVQAYAVSLGDAKSFGLSALQGDTDYHVFERYVLPGAISFVQAFGLSASQKGSTAVTDNGSVGTTTPGLTRSDRVAVALGSAMTPLMNDIRQRGQRPITVSLPAGTEIGIMFGTDVQNPATMRINAAASSDKSISTMTEGSSSANSVRMLQQNANQALAASNMQSQMAIQQYQQSYNAGAANQPSYNGAQSGYQQPPYGAYR